MIGKADAFPPNRLVRVFYEEFDENGRRITRHIVGYPAPDPNGGILVRRPGNTSVYIVAFTKIEEFVEKNGGPQA